MIKFNNKKIFSYFQNVDLLKIFPFALMILLSLIFFYPIIFENKTFFAFDCLFHYLPWSTYVPPDFKAQNTLITDPINGFYFSLFYPAQYYYQSSLSTGDFGLWFNLNFCGVPFTFFSNPFLYFFYSFFPLTIGHDLLLFFHLLGTGCFTYLYLKEIKLNMFPALIGAVAWMFNGFAMVWFEFEHTTMMAMTLPGTLLFIERWLKNRSILSFLGLIFFLALSISISIAHLLIFQLIFVGFYILYRILCNLKNIEQKWKKIFHPLYIFGIAIIFAIIISANFFTTNIMTYKDNQRKAFSYNELFKNTGQLPVKYLTTLIFPDFFGSPAMDYCFTPRSNNKQMYNNYNELCIYPGIFTLFLSLAVIPYIGKKRYLSFFILTALLSLSMAMGSILYYPLAKFIPGLNLSTPTRILYLFGFSISVLAGLGAEIIYNNKNHKLHKKIITILWTLLFLTTTGIVCFVQSEKGIIWAASSIMKLHGLIDYPEFLDIHFSLNSTVILIPMLLTFIVFLILLCLLYSPQKKYHFFVFCLGIIILSYDLISFGLFYNTACPRKMEYPSTPGIRFLQKDKSKFRIMTFGSFLQHSFVPFEIEDLSGYGSFYPKRYAQYLHLSQHDLNTPFPEKFSRWITFKKFGSPLLDIVNTKYLLTPKSMSLDLKELELIYNNEIKIYKNINAFDRVWFAKKYYLARDAQDAYQTLGKFCQKDFQDTVILETQPPPDFVEKGHSLPVKNEKYPIINIISYSSSKIELKLENEYNGFLIISDNYHPGWEVKIDGKESTILRGNYIMRSIPIKAGKHSVILSFKPKILIAGISITFIGWVILLFLIGFYII